jgi:hypothetical protein
MARETGKAKRYPREVMHDVHWSFRGPKFRSRAKFVEAVRQYYEDLGADGDWQPGDWRPDEVVLRAARVRVSPDVADTSWEEDPIAELTADDGEAFTAGELLFKVHNAFVALLRNGDHVFFEGFTLATDQRKSGPPLYDLDLGS